MSPLLKAATNASFCSWRAFSSPESALSPATDPWAKARRMRTPAVEISRLLMRRKRFNILITSAWNDSSALGCRWRGALGRACPGLLPSISESYGRRATGNPAITGTGTWVDHSMKTFFRQEGELQQLAVTSGQCGICRGRMQLCARALAARRSPRRFQTHQALDHKQQHAPYRCSKQRAESYAEG